MKLSPLRRNLEYLILKFHREPDYKQEDRALWVNHFISLEVICIEDDLYKVALHISGRKRPIIQGPCSVFDALPIGPHTPYETS